MSRKKFATLIYSLVLVSIPALAQEDYTQYRGEVTAQATGNFVKSTTHDGITEKADNTGGVLAGYRLYFNRYNGVELNYGYTQNTEKYGSSGVKTNSNEISGAYVFRFPMKRWSPFALAGVSGMIFDPKNFTGASTQTRPAFLYGGGMDFNVSSHLFVRAEYQGFVYNSPTYDVSSLNGLDRVTHRAEPSIGFGWRF
jgi:opacity protein-like surface antigen